MALIIVAEDDESVRLAIKAFLEDDGHDCLEFSNGEDALEAVRNTPDVSLLILDIFMPSSNGRDIVTILRNGPPRFRNMPVILISGVVPEETIRSHAKDKYCRFLEKPFSRDLLNATINSLIVSQPS